MKIGIITFHRANNYGAVLQCYALCDIMRTLGHRVEVIDYYPNYFKSEYALLPSLRSGTIVCIKRFLKTLPVLTIKKKRIELFRNFIVNNLPLSNEIYDEKNNSIKGYDVVVFGSDQIWNPLLSEGVDKVYAGGIPRNNMRFVSYAASTSPIVCNDSFYEYFKGIINSFDSISAREDSLTTYLNHIKPNVAKTVLDPVLLPQVSIWDRFAKKPIEEDFLLIYTVPQSHRVRPFAQFVADKLGLKIIEVTPYAKRMHDISLRQIVGPEDFVGYFKYAKYIVSTSFHGTAFAIKYNKPFTTISVGGNADDRSFNLLKKLGLEDRFLKSDNFEDQKLSIDYTSANIRLQELIHYSLDYLMHAL